MDDIQRSTERAKICPKPELDCLWLRKYSLLATRNLRSPKRD